MLRDIKTSFLGSLVIFVFLLIATILRHWIDLESSEYTKNIGLYEYSIEFKQGVSGRDGTYKLSCDSVSDYTCTFLRTSQQSMVFALLCNLVQVLIILYLHKLSVRMGALEALLLTTSLLSFLFQIIILSVFPFYHEDGYEEQDDIHFSTNKLGASFYLVETSASLQFIVGMLLLINIMGWREQLFGVSLAENEYYQFSVDHSPIKPNINSHASINDSSAGTIASNDQGEGKEKEEGTNNHMLPSVRFDEHHSNSPYTEMQGGDDIDSVLDASGTEDQSSWNADNNGGYHTSTQFTNQSDLLK